MILTHVLQVYFLRLPADEGVRFRYAESAEFRRTDLVIVHTSTSSSSSSRQQRRRKITGNCHQEAALTSRCAVIIIFFVREHRIRQHIFCTSCCC